MTTNLFVYGALMYEPVWRRLVSGEFRKVQARLSGYRRFRIRGEEYPGIIRGDGHVDGIIYLNLDGETLRRLDEFEAECYQRISEQAIDTVGRMLCVDTYIVQDAYRSLVDESGWDPDEFEHAGLQRFLSDYKGFDSEG